MTERVGKSPVSTGHAELPFTPALRAGDFVFVSGQLGFGPDGKLVGSGIDEQVRACVRNIEALLKRAGGDLTALVKVNAWLIDKNDFGAFNAAYRELVPEPRPARSTVVSALLVEGARVEIDAVAYLPQ
jgi:reactive intermediate/imine deaminase